MKFRSFRVFSPFLFAFFGLLSPVCSQNAVTVVGYNFRIWSPSLVALEPVGTAQDGSETTFDFRRVYASTNGAQAATQTQTGLLVASKAGYSATVAAEPVATKNIFMNGIQEHFECVYGDPGNGQCVQNSFIIEQATTISGAGTYTGAAVTQALAVTSFSTSATPSSTNLTSSGPSTTSTTSQASSTATSRSTTQLPSSVGSDPPTTVSSTSTTSQASSSANPSPIAPSNSETSTQSINSPVNPSTDTAAPTSPSTTQLPSTSSGATVTSASHVSSSTNPSSIDTSPSHSETSTQSISSPVNSSADRAAPTPTSVSTTQPPSSVGNDPSSTGTPAQSSDGPGQPTDTSSTTKTDPPIPTTAQVPSSSINDSRVNANNRPLATDSTNTNNMPTPTQKRPDAPSDVTTECANGACTTQASESSATSRPVLAQAASPNSSPAGSIITVFVTQTVTQVPLSSSSGRGTSAQSTGLGASQTDVPAQSASGTSSTDASNASGDDLNSEPPSGVSNTSGADNTTQSATPKGPNVNKPALIGSVAASTTLIIVVAFFTWFRSRRRDKRRRRGTRDQEEILPLSSRIMRHLRRNQSEVTPYDLKYVPEPVSPESPVDDSRSSFDGTDESMSLVPASTTYTARQRRIQQEAADLRGQLSSLQSTVDSSNTGIQDMQMAMSELVAQIRALEGQLNSDYARELTDDLPPNYASLSTSDQD
ncbi:hypothetical protein VKT23_013772 [Stygiomarasmius scandens]|uniref:Uncharacterized protein n=1 Tax=Marasmiellus scandens TaxID=2682957 RepID=A0ABR1J5B1_9AGAR